MVISLCNQKGGVGKTTLAINIAFCIAKKFSRKVLLIDADPQGSAMQWHAIAEMQLFDVNHQPYETLHQKIKQLSKNYQITIIDSPPGTGDISLSVLLASQLTIVPIEPSALSIWASTDIIDLIKEAKQHNKKLTGKILISRKVIGTIPARDVRNALITYNLQLFKTDICHRIDFVKAFILGQSVIQYAPNSAASKEIKALCKEILY